MTAIDWRATRSKPAIKGSASDKPFSHFAKLGILLGCVVISDGLFSGLSFAAYKIILG